MFFPYSFLAPYTRPAPSNKPIPPSIGTPEGPEGPEDEPVAGGGPICAYVATLRKINAAIINRGK